MRARMTERIVATTRVEGARVKPRPSPINMKMRLYVVLMVLALGSSALIVRAVDLQVVRKDFYQEQGDARFLREVEIPVSRGTIFDRNGEALAVSTPVKSVWAIPGDVDAGDRERRKLASLLAMQKIELDKRLGDGSRDFVYQAPDRSRDRGGGAATRPQGHSRARRISALLSRR